MQRSPQGEKWIIVPYRGNVEVSESAPKFRIAHLLEVFPENRAIVKPGRRCALGSETAQKHDGDVVVESRRRLGCRIRPEVVVLQVDPFRKFV